MEEPRENIGGATGTDADTSVDSTAADTRAAAVVAELGELYWQRTYGGREAFDCLVRTVLSQNTSDVASQPAHDALLDRYGGEGTDLAAVLAAADREELAETISGAGLYNQKSAVIQRAAERVVEEDGSAAGFDRYVREQPPEAVRERLLSLHGVGPKTADCVLLFSGGRDGVFPVDTHVHRIARRMGLAPADADHETVREFLERDVPAGQCGFGHTAMIQFGRDYCTAREPACLDGPEACPLAAYCEQVGVDVGTGEVVDPADAD
jgi:endonuclease-3